MKKNKNHTFFWIVALSIILTIPISILIINNVQAGSLVKSTLIMAVFVLLFIIIMILYKNIFGVSLQEITRDEKMTEIDRLIDKIVQCRKNHSNSLLIQCMNKSMEQLQRFNRRKIVMFQVAAEFDPENDGSLHDLVQTVEDALAINTERLVNRIEIFDDRGSPKAVLENLNYMEERIQKNEEILAEFEALITETSRTLEVHEDKDISKLRDVVNAMKSLRNDNGEAMDSLYKKYDEMR